MPETVTGKRPKPRGCRMIVPATMPGRAQVKQHRSDRHHRRHSLLGMGDTTRGPTMAAYRDTRCSIVVGEIGQGQREEYFKLGVRWWNGINDVIAMERLGRFCWTNLDRLRKTELIHGAVRLQETIADAQHQWPR